MMVTATRTRAKGRVSSRAGLGVMVLVASTGKPVCFATILSGQVIVGFVAAVATSSLSARMPGKGGQLPRWLQLGIQIQNLRLRDLALRVLRWLLMARAVRRRSPLEDRGKREVERPRML